MAKLSSGTGRNVGLQRLQLRLRPFCKYRPVELELSQLFAHINATCMCQASVGRNGVCLRTRQCVLDQRLRLRATLISAKFAGPTSLLSSPGLRTFVVKNQVGIQYLVIGVRQ